MFIDMQSVNDAEFEAAGRWHNVTLMPWGVLYRVLKVDGFHPFPPLARTLALALAPPSSLIYRLELYAMAFDHWSIGFVSDSSRIYFVAAHAVN